MAAAPEWGPGKSKRQVGRFEAILFAPDMIQLMLRLKAMLKTIFPGAVVRREPKRGKSPNHGVMWRLPVTVGYLKKAPQEATSRHLHLRMDHASSNRAKLTIGVASEPHNKKGYRDPHQDLFSGRVL